MKDDLVYLRHILDCLEAIEQYTRGNPELFLGDRKTQKAVLRELQELAESTQRLSGQLKATYQEIAWGSIAGFRNVLVHDYLGLSLSRIWDIVIRDLPVLRAVVAKVLSNPDATGPEDSAIPQ